MMAMPVYHIKDDSWQVDQLPHVCPRCKKHIAAMPEARASASELHLECLFSCPSCLRYFISAYYVSQYTGNAEFSYSLPSSYTDREFPRLQQISASFHTIYNQAAQADTIGLSEIAGIGYRKALEFLIKDYCLSLHPHKADDVRRSFLGNAIRDFIDDGKLKRAATMTAWLGNDEGHYERRWADKDLADLKALLELTIAFVDEEIQLEFYTRSMQPESPHRLKLLEEFTSAP